MSVLAGFAIVITEAMLAFYKRIHAIQFGVYGATMVGKTTLHHQLRTRGEVPEIKGRTVGLHKGTRKTIKIEAWKFLVDAICANTWPNGKKKKEADYPLAIGIWGNKYDIWGEKHPYEGEIEDHPIFEPFKYGMRRLNDKGIPTFKYIVSAKSQPEMVYRGVMTMIKDY